jgi:hypothetical protein
MRELGTTIRIHSYVRFFCLRGIGQPSQTALGFNLDWNLIVQGTNDRDLKFRVHLGEPLRVQDLKKTYSFYVEGSSPA